MSMFRGIGSEDLSFFTNKSDWIWNGGNTVMDNDSVWNEILSDDDVLKGNNSALNMTRFDEDANIDYVIDDIGYFLAILTLILVIVCWVCNAIVVRALNQLDDDRMKIKFLLKNAILGDVLVSISFAIRSIFAMTDLLEKSHAGVVARCINVFYGFFGYFAVFYQISTSMAVACDRFYSILKPLEYHSMRYSRCAKVTILAVILVVVTSLSVPVALVKLQPGKPLIYICLDAYSHSYYSTAVLPYIILSSVFFILFIYCGVLCLIAYHRRVHRDTLGEMNENQNDRRRQASLAITFFLIHISYVIMYMPGPIYFSLRPPALKANLDYYFTQITLMIYLSNTVLDPLIYIFRIKSIRNSVRRIFAREEKKDLSYSMSSQNTTL